MGLVGGVLGFFIGLPIGLAAAYFVYLRYFAARRLQVSTTTVAGGHQILLQRPTPRRRRPAARCLISLEASAPVHSATALV
ncbi:unnamed protein product [Urochloa humidicola]